MRRRSRSRGPKAPRHGRAAEGTALGAAARGKGATGPWRAAVGTGIPWEQHLVVKLLDRGKRRNNKLRRNFLRKNGEEVFTVRVAIFI